MSVIQVCLPLALQVTGGGSIGGGMPQDDE